jgi:hypothetical protein
VAPVNSAGLVEVRAKMGDRAVPIISRVAAPHPRRRTAAAAAATTTKHTPNSTSGGACYCLCPPVMGFGTCVNMPAGTVLVFPAEVYTRGMPLVPMPARLELLYHACGQYQSDQVFTPLIGGHRTPHRNTEGTQPGDCSSVLPHAQAVCPAHGAPRECHTPEIAEDTARCSSPGCP